MKLSAPINPPSTLLPPPVTAPVAELMAIVPSPAPTRPPATLAAPTLTLPPACASTMTAALKNGKPSPIRQPTQLKVLGELEPASPPAMLVSPVCTLPSAVDDTIAPELSPTSPPACRLATLGLPTLPRANESTISP